MNQKKLERMVSVMESESGWAPTCGGTVSSMFLRDCYFLEKQTDDHDLKTRILALIGIWRAALKRHNDQPIHLITYDLDTGLPVNEPQDF